MLIGTMNPELEFRGFSFRACDFILMSFCFTTLVSHSNTLGLVLVLVSKLKLLGYLLASWAMFGPCIISMRGFVGNREIQAPHQPIIKFESAT